MSLLVAGYDRDKATGNKIPVIFQCDPSGAYFAWKATALGKNHLNARAFLEKRSANVFESTFLGHRWQSYKTVARTCMSDD